MNLKFHIKIALGYFFIVALLGVFLRMFQVVDSSINYKYILHTHSHVALLGWIYTAITTLIYKFYLNKKSVEKYKVIFWSTQITIIGMLLTFPFIGYALFSILFSTLFLIASYFFVWFFLKNTTKEQKETNSYKLIRASLWFMVLSSLGPWVLGVIMNTLGSTSSWYRNAIYFYLHFQYNGWFIVAQLGMLFFVFEKYRISISKKEFSLFYRLFSAGVILTFFLSVLWMQHSRILGTIFYILAGIGGLFQLAAVVILFRRALLNKNKLKAHFSKIDWILLKTVAILFLIKLIIQLMGSLPYIAAIVSTNKDFVIGYLHWVFLGLITISIVAFLNHFKLIVISKWTFIIYLIAFILTEVLIFYKGTIAWLGSSLFDDYFFYLFLVSTLFLIPVFGLLFSFNNNQKEYYK